MRSSTLLLVAAIAGSGFCQSYSTFKDFLNTLPSCSRSCGTTTYKRIVDGCGGEGAKIECICVGPGDVTAAQAFSDGEDGGRCASKNCNSSDLQNYLSALFDLSSFCLKNFNVTSSASNPSSSSGSNSSPSSSSTPGSSSNSGSSSGSNSGSSSSSSSSPSSGSNKLVAPALALGLVGFGLTLAI